jgi:hypothetical protein
MRFNLDHDYFLKNVKRLPEDYKPFGEVERWSNPEIDYPDCSMGCKYYAPLQGKLGSDWGVCLNSDSHRCGLLTFEHQGCQKFKFDKK